MKSIVRLKTEEIISTVEKLVNRINERFPEAGLGSVCQNLLEISRKGQKNLSWISKPNLPLRIFAYVIVVIGVFALVYSLVTLKVDSSEINFMNVITVSEALFNEVVLLGAAIFFLVTVETRIKRLRVLKLLNELRVIAHVIDMHQLTKDPSMMTGLATQSSPKRTMTNFELQRYLDYCSEAFSLIGKVAATYAQAFPDEVVVRSVNEIETLTTGLSNKVWQKLIVLNEMGAQQVNVTE